MNAELNMIEVETPRGRPVRLTYREGTSDLSVIGGMFRLWGKLDDEYGFGSEHPRTYLDIGGHIGTTAVSVLADNPDCRAVILEPLPENAALIDVNLAANGLADRATVVVGAIGAGDRQRIGYRLPRVADAEDVDQFVGGPVGDDYAGEAVTVPAYPLGDLIDLLGQTIDLAKIDCEGCEWTALQSPDIDRVRTWVGEYHGVPARSLDLLFLEGFSVTVQPHPSGGTGMFRAVAA